MNSTVKMSEEQAVNLVRNSLIVAGMEMGAEGDHWPVIKATVHSIAKDWEALKIERNVAAEVKKYYEGMLKELDTLRKGSPDGLKIEIDNALEQLREVYFATFSDINEEAFYVSEEEIPPYIERAKVIMGTLDEEENG